MVIMEWYWYLTGAGTVLFIESVLFNYAQYKGWVKFHKRTKAPIHRVYDQDNSGPYKRAL
jgi:hypothetical protein